MSVLWYVWPSLASQSLFRSAAPIAFSIADTESDRRCGTEWGWLARLCVAIMESCKKLTHVTLVFYQHAHSTGNYLYGVFSGCALFEANHMHAIHVM